MAAKWLNGEDLDFNRGLLSDGLLVRLIGHCVLALPRWWCSVIPLRAFLAAARRFLISAMHSLHCEAGLIFGENYR
jgi:hypothetical protein